jgi:hypothetical protein
MRQGEGYASEELVKLFIKNQTACNVFEKISKKE